MDTRNKSILPDDVKDKQNRPTIIGGSDNSEDEFQMWEVFEKNHYDDCQKKEFKSVLNNFCSEKKPNL